MDHMSSTKYRTTARNQYFVANAPCRYCRRRKLRCIPNSHDLQGRCTSCIRMKKECTLRGGWPVEATNQEDDIQPGSTVEKEEDKLDDFVARNASYQERDEPGWSYEASTLGINSLTSGWRRDGEAWLATYQGFSFASYGEELHRSREYRGRTRFRDRSTSPIHYSENERTRSQSPAHSFYHGDSPARVASPVSNRAPTSHRGVSPSYEKAYALSDQESLTTFADKVHPDSRRTEGYQYTSLLENEIRLLRITPGLFESPLSCSLKIISMDKIVTVVHEFQALSYAWGNDPPSHEILLSDLPRSGDELSTIGSRQPQAYSIRGNLYQALRHIRLTDEHLWLWVDALCIDQTNNNEKSQQIPKLPCIYSNAWNVIAWLGDDESLRGGVEEAVSLVPDILNLKTLDIDLRGDILDENVLRSWVSFGNLLEQPWFERRWVIQEVACARKLSVRIANKILSWLDFADAVDLYSANIDRMRVLYHQSALFETEPAALDRIKSTKAVALMRFSRSIFRKCSDPSIVSKLMNLETLVLAASSFAVSDVRDVVYALLHLANEGFQSINNPVGWVPSIFKSDYSKHPVKIFEEFINHSIESSRSLQILCRRWASWPGPSRNTAYQGRILPSYIGVASFNQGGPCQRRFSPEDLLGPVGGQIYDASRGVAMPAMRIPQAIDDMLKVAGMVLGTVERVSALPVHNGMLKKNWLAMLGWGGTLGTDIDDGLWRTLVANRDPDSRVAPTWYRRACALALTKLDGDGHLDSTALMANNSQPSTLISYLRRVQVATENKKIFRCTKSVSSEGNTGAEEQVQETIVGLGPEDMGFGGHQWVCILYGCSVPVILNEIDGRKYLGDRTRHVKLTGPCYVHGYMEGEIFAGMSEEDIQSRSTTFSIH